MPLTHTKLQSLKPKAAIYRVADSAGLCIEVAPTGSRYWRFRYRFAGKAKMISLGVYPEQSLAEARKARDEARAMLRKGVDPSSHRKQARLALSTAAENTFEVVAREYLGKLALKLETTTLDKAKAHLESHVFPWLGARAVSSITPPELLAVLRRVEERGKLETAHRVLQRCSQIFRYAIATGRAERDPAADLRGALATAPAKHHAAITEPKALGELLRVTRSYQGQFVTACALKFAPLVFVRPGELRHAEWSEVDFDAAEWRIPASKMKMRDPHIVPLSEQAVALLRELQPLTGTGRYLFPSVRSNKQPMSENTVLAALRRLGYTADQMTGHGFRSTASTRLHEMGWASHLIELQLAHAERNQVKAAYNHALYLDERRKMMQAWADYLDRLAQGGSVVTGRFDKAAA